MHSEYLVITPAGKFTADFLEHSVEYSGDDEAIEYFRQHLLLDFVSGNDGHRLSPENIQPFDLWGFCQSDTIMVIPPADDAMAYAAYEQAQESDEMNPILDAVDSAQEFALIGEGAKLLKSLDENSADFFTSLGRLREIIVALGGSADAESFIVPDGWTETPGGTMIANKDPLTGGIIDKAIASGKWFVIFNREDLSAIEDLPSREAAFAAFSEVIARAKKPAMREIPDEKELDRAASDGYAAGMHGKTTPPAWVEFNKDLLSAWNDGVARGKADAANAPADHAAGLDALKKISPFLSGVQRKVTAAGMKGKEGQFFIDKAIELADRIDKMPKSYEQDGKGNDAIVYLHYFKGGADWYITEKDMQGEGTEQAFGLADLFNDGGELGYISIAELAANGVELDYHFDPKTLGSVRGKDAGDEKEPAPGNEALKMAEGIAAGKALAITASDEVGGKVSKWEVTGAENWEYAKVAFARFGVSVRVGASSGAVVSVNGHPFDYSNKLNDNLDSILLSMGLAIGSEIAPQPRGMSDAAYAAALSAMRDANQHSEALLFEAKRYGRDEQVAKAALALLMREKAGSLTPEAENLQEQVSRDVRAAKSAAASTADASPGQEAIDAIINSTYFKGITRDFVSSLGTIGAIDAGGMAGFDRTLFVSSITGKVKRVKDKLTQKLLLAWLSEAQKALPKPAITARNSVWNLAPGWEPYSILFKKAGAATVAEVEPETLEAMAARFAGELTDDEKKSALVGFIPPRLVDAAKAAGLSPKGLINALQDVLEADMTGAEQGAKPAPMEPVKEIPGTGEDPEKTAARGLLQSVIDGSADMLSADLADRLTAVGEKYESDPDLGELFNQAATAYGDFMVAQAKAALNG